MFGLMAATSNDKIGLVVGDGTDNSVSIPNVVGVNDGVGDFTVTFKLIPGLLVTANSVSLIEKGSTGNCFQVMRINTAGQVGQVVMGALNNTASRVNTPVLDDTTLYNLAFTYTLATGQVRGFMNKTVLGTVRTGIAAPTLNTSAWTLLARTATTKIASYASMGDIAFYNRVLTDDEVLHNFYTKENVRNGLFQEFLWEAGSLVDTSGNNITATLVAGTTISNTIIRP